MLEQLRHDRFRDLAILGRGVDTKLFGPARRSEELRRSWGAAPESPVLLYVGRLAPEKNLDVVVRAAEAAMATRPDAVLVLVGDGPMRADLERRLPDACFAGMRTGQDLARHYASGDLFVFPSTTETFGNVTTEALASGLVVVAYDYAAAREHIVDGRNGVTVPLDDAEAFIRATALWVDRAMPAIELRHQARATAERLGWSEIAEKWIDDLRPLIEPSKKSGTAVAAGESAL
jgi:glycosyltransferase involved in cell wall biosynthesis